MPGPFIDILDLIADGEFPKRSGTTLTGDGISELAADVANNAAAQTVLDARYGPGGTLDLVDTAIGDTRYVRATDMFQFSAAPQLAFRRRLDAAVNPAIVTVFGDSTGNDTNEWPRLLTDQLVDNYPGHTVAIRAWRDATQDYGGALYRQEGTAGLGYLTPSSGGASSPDSAVKSVTASDFMLKAKVRKTLLAAGGSEYVIASHFGLGGNRSWELFMGNGPLTFRYCADGSTLVDVTIASAVQVAAQFDDDTDFFVGVTLDINNGSGNTRVAAITSSDGVTWSEFGTAVSSGAAIAGLFDSTAAVEVGSRGTGAGSWDGRIYWVEVYKGITDAATLAWRFDASLWLSGTTFEDVEGNTWTAIGSGAFTAGAPLLLVMNGSVPGATISYFEAARQTQLVAPPANLTMFNFGHNETAVDVQATYEAFIADVKAANPSSGIVVNRQNPQRPAATNYARQNRHQANIAEMAARNGYGVIDAFQQFVDAADYANDLMTDDVHPNTAGGIVWATEATRTFGFVYA